MSASNAGSLIVTTGPLGSIKTDALYTAFGTIAECTRWAGGIVVDCSITVIVETIADLICWIYCVLAPKPGVITTQLCASLAFTFISATGALFAVLADALHTAFGTIAE